jgi:FkbM family methyltransferase
VSLLYFNKYEKEEVQMIRKYMRTDLPIIDLGTSHGVVATNAACLTKENILCVEANPNLSEVISGNLTRNGVENSRFSVMNAAICDVEQAGEPIYFSSRGSNELGRICDAQTEGAIKVDTVLLSDIVKKNVKDDFVLISDVEGAEAAFLYSDSDALESCNQLFIELHPVNWKGRELSVTELQQRIELLGFVQNEQRGMNFYYSRHGKK